MRVLVTGAAGSGTTTLATALAKRWQAVAVEADTFYWLPTELPYTTKRDPGQRNALFERELRSHLRCVVAGSVVGWGVEALLDLTVFLYVDSSVRVGRILTREEALFGKANAAFLEWAAQYDEGPPQGRSLAKHEAWLATLSCPVVRLVGELPVSEQLARITAVAPDYSHPG